MKDVLQKSSISFILQIFGAVLTYIFHILIARFLGASEYGIYVYIMSWILLLSTPASLGMQTATLRFIPEYKAKKNWKLLYGFIRTSTNFTLSTGIIFALIINLLLIILGENHNSNFYTSFLIATLLIPLMVIANLQSARFKAIGNIILAFIPHQILQPAFLIAFIYFLHSIEFKLNSKLIFLLYNIIILFLIFTKYYFLRKKIYINFKKIKIQYDIYQWLKISLPLLLIAGFQIVLNRSDTIMVGIFIGTKEAGIYNVAARTANILGFILVAVSSVVVPMFSQLYTKEKIKELQILVSKSSHIIFWPSLISAILIIIFSKYIFLLFGREFVVAQCSLYILLIGQIINAFAGSVGALLNMTGNQNYSAGIYGLSAIINIILNVIFIPKYGIIGAAIATMFTMILWNIGISIIVIKKLNIYPSIIGTIVK